ncbi:uncharacterized protein [Drosophila kikkawai]|uniref:Integrase catalytic domain-containing protein n=1 Tax=Drosophila kikkawai TaxID=30033 RepID=A0ABM4GI90_DROKI
MEIQYTAPYTPQQNPTERANRTIKTMVAQYIEDKQTTWDELLPEFNLAINSSISDSTGFSPAFIVQGREPRLPGALYDEHLHSRQRRTAALGDLKEAVNEPETQNLVPSRLDSTEDEQTTEQV